MAAVVTELIKYSISRFSVYLSLRLYRELTAGMEWTLCYSGELLTVVWLVATIAARAASVLPTSGLNAEPWRSWKSTHGKNYVSTDEEVSRYSIWLDNMKYIEQHNTNSDQHGFTLGMNHFGDLVSKRET